MNIDNKNSINFCSGLNAKILIKEKFINTKSTEAILFNNYGINAIFCQNKTIALANKLCMKIFENLANLLQINFTPPPYIQVYNRNNLINKSLSENFCLTDTQEILNNDLPFPGRSIFFQNIKNFKYINKITDLKYNNKKISSSHFLSPFIHEWVHSFQLDKIYNQYGYGGNCYYLNEIYPINNTKSGCSLLKELETKKLSTAENKIVYNVLGEYSTLPYNQYLEIYSETITKFICESLENCVLVKNPIELLKKSCANFQEIFYKICMFK